MVIWLTQVIGSMRLKVSTFKDFFNEFILSADSYALQSRENQNMRTIRIFGQLAQAIVEMEIGLCSTSKVVVSKFRGDLQF